MTASKKTLDLLDPHDAVRDEVHDDVRDEAPEKPHDEAGGDDVVVIYADGACKGNPGRGGWGAWLAYKGRERELWGGEALTTNNRMELTAVIRALEALARPCSVRVVTDSEYVRNGISTWIHNWKLRGWRTASKQPVKNVDLWQQLDALAQRHRVRWEWVRGHSGDPGNERADALANRGAMEAGSAVKT